MHPRDSLYANYVHTAPGTTLICEFHPQGKPLARPRGARGVLRRSAVAADLEAMVLGHVLANLRDDVRANYDLPAILQALGALGCASSLEYLAAGRCGSREACL